MKTTIAFPSPRRGPIFSTMKQSLTVEPCISFRPHEGDPSSLPVVDIAHRLAVVGFRPHEGDPSSLLSYNPFLNKFVDVSVPTKGTHLLYNKERHIK